MYRLIVAGLVAFATTTGEAAFEVTPQHGLIDEPLSIRLRGVASGASVTILASWLDEAGQRWVSRATYRAGTNGVVDLGATAPDSGTYHGIDPMGLFWSMHLESPATSPAAAMPYATTLNLKPVMVSLIAAVNGHAVAATAIERRFLGDGVSRQDIRAEALVGSLFLPRGSGRSPVTLVVTGSIGGEAWSRQVAALLASRGRAAMSLAYFDWQGKDGLPNELAEIPLEYFKRAIDYLAGHPRVDSTDIAVAGISKGGELALLLGATYSDIRRVVAYVPSSVVWEAARMRRGPPVSSWTVGGKPLPFVRFNADSAFYANPDQRRLLDFHRRGLADKGAVAAASIPVERTVGEILLISAGGDGVWPSEAMADQVERRLREKKFPHRVKHLRLPGVGHVIGVPYLPASTLDGADQATNAAGDVSSWWTALDFLGIKPPHAR